MPFKKRKEAKEKTVQEFNDRHLELEKKFADMLEKAGTITDPAEKVLVIRKVEKAISAQITAENNVIDHKAANTDDKIFFTGTGTSLAAGAAVAVFGGPIGWVLALPVWVGGSLAGAAVASKRAKATEKKLKEASGSHLERLQELDKRAYAMADAVVEKNVETISQSPLYGKVLALPGISQKFSDAAAKHISTVKEAAPEAAPPVKKAPQKRPPKKPPSDFGRITKVGE